MHDLDLKRFAIDMARHAGPNMVTVAKDLYAFLAETPITAVGLPLVPGDKGFVEQGYEPPVATFPEVPHAELPVRQHGLPALTTMQKAVLKVCIELWKEEAKVNSTDIGRRMNWTNPASANTYVKVLVKMGYIRRDGWYITPQFHHDGTKVATVVQRLPPGVAKGYQPMTAKLGEVGRIS